jgi:hypothetical protein
VEKAIKLFSICMLVSVILICGTIIFKTCSERYYLRNEGGIAVLDKFTGTTYTPAGGPSDKYREFKIWK